MRQEFRIFFEGVRIQVQGAEEHLDKIIAEFQTMNANEPAGSRLRLETKNFISAIKQILDQTMAQVWEYFCASELSEADWKRKRKSIYYPYGDDLEKIRAALGKFLPLSSLDAGTASKGENSVYAWAMQNHSLAIATPIFNCLGTICQLSRLPHTKLIEQKKIRVYILSAYGPHGGGSKMSFPEKPPAFTTWTYTDIHASMSGIGSPPIVDKEKNPNATLNVFHFDPETMDFEAFEGAQTSVQEVMECHVEEKTFDALPLFGSALLAAMIVTDNAYRLIHNHEIENLSI